jgi:hypothetical protein
VLFDLIRVRTESTLRGKFLISNHATEIVCFLLDNPPKISYFIISTNKNY